MQSKVIFPSAYTFESNESTNPLAYFDYINHFLKYEGQSHIPTVEIEALLTTFQTEIKANGSQYYFWYVYSSRILASIEVRGEEELQFYRLFFEIFHCNPNHTDAKKLSLYKINSLFTLVKAEQRYEECRSFLAKELISSIDSYIKENKDWPQKHGLEINKILDSYIYLGLYKSHMTILADYIELWFQAQNEYMSEVTLFCIGKIIIRQKDYAMMRRLFALANTDEQFITLTLAVHLLDDIPEDLFDCKLSPPSIIQPNIAKYITNKKNLSIDQALTHIIDCYEPYMLDMEIHFLTESLTQNYSSKEIIEALDRCEASIPSSLLIFFNYTFNDETVQQFDLNTKKKLVKIIPANCFNLFNVLPNQTQEEQRELISLYNPSNMAVYSDKDKFLAHYPLVLQSSQATIPVERSLKLPLGLYFAIQNEGKSIPDSFYIFYERFKKANGFALQQVGKRAVIEYSEFMSAYSYQLMNLYACMGDNLFPFMTKMLATSVLNLQRYLTNIQLIPNDFFSFLKGLQDQYHKEIICANNTSYDTLLHYINQFEIVFSECKKDTSFEWKSSRQGFIKELTALREEGYPLTSLVSLCLNQTLSLYKVLLKIPADNAIDKSIFENNPKFMQRLLIARRAMALNPLKEIFETSVQYDLTKELSFNDFANNLSQDPTSLGYRLSAHNKGIIDYLSSNNINTDLALHYLETSVFSVSTGKEVDLLALAQTLYADVNNLQKSSP